MTFRSLKKWTARSTVFAMFFAVTSFILARNGQLTGVYVAMCTAVQAMVVSRAIASDYHDRAKNNGTPGVGAPGVKG